MKKLAAITNNWVLVLPEGNFDKIGSTGMEVADVFDPGKHIAIFGKVLQLPEQLICEERQIKRLSKGLHHRAPAIRAHIQEMNAVSLEFNTDNELLVGDRIAFNYLSILNAMEDEHLFWETEQGRAVLIPYDLIYATVREGGWMPINGWLMVEPIGKTLADIEKEGSMRYDDQGAPKEGIGVVRRIGKPLHGYLHDEYIDTNFVKEGDKILFRRSLQTPIEFAMHKQMNEGRYPFIRMQRKDILAVVGWT